MEKLVPICRNNDFRRIYARGKSYVSPLVVVYALKNRTKNVRVGITTSKKVGNAVQRNRSRRVIREAFRALAPRVRPGFDLVLVARGKTPYVKSTDGGWFVAGGNAMKRALLWLIRFYRSAISPRKPAMCKYIPTCSQYGLEAIERFGAFKGGLLTLWRILRCNPWSRGGYDPVPEKKDKRKKLG